MECKRISRFWPQFWKPTQINYKKKIHISPQLFLSIFYIYWQQRATPCNLVDIFLSEKKSISFIHLTKTEKKKKRSRESQNYNNAILASVNTLRKKNNPFISFNNFAKRQTKTMYLFCSNKIDSCQLVTKCNFWWFSKKKQNEANFYESERINDGIQRKQKPTKSIKNVYILFRNLKSRNIFSWKTTVSDTKCDRFGFTKIFANESWFVIREPFNLNVSKVRACFERCKLMIW